MPYKNKTIKKVQHKLWRDQRKLQWNGVDPRDVFVGRKTCRRCGLDKKPEEFNVDWASVDGLHVWCKACHLQKRRLTRFGVEMPEGAVCEICGDKATCVDHDHVTGLTRGFLCQGCNLGLGKFKDSPERLEGALTYLEKYVKIVEIS